jgi:hypothetical protein
LIDWDTIQIVDVLDDGGRLEVASEEQIYAILGLQKEDESEKKGMGGSGACCSVQNESDDSAAVIPIFQQLLGERQLFDRSNPMMEPRSVYPSMKEVRLAMQQYAIDKEFELGIKATNKVRYGGYCHGRDCPWSINARVEQKGWDHVVVTVLNDVHDSMSSGRRRTTAPSSNWVAYRALPILMSEPNLGVKKLQKKLQEKYNVQIRYDTVWHGKEKAMTDMYGTWQKNFQQLLNWKAAMMKISPDSVIELDVHMVDDKIFFRRFFYALGPCINGFLVGC